MRPAPVLLAVALVLAGGCGVAAPPPEAPAALVLVSPLQQSRSDSDRRVVALPVRNVTAAPLTVVLERLDSARFEPLPPTVRSDPLQPGERVDLRLPYGPARCPGTPGEAAAVLDVRTADGTVRTQRVELAPPVQVLDLIHGIECRQQEFAAAFAPTLTAAAPAALVRGTPTLPAVLAFRRGSGRDPLVVRGITGSRLFDLVPARLPGGGAPLLTLAPGSSSARLPVRLQLPGCEAHVVSQANQAYDFSLEVQVGGRPPEDVRLVADAALVRGLGALAPLCASS